MSYQPEFTITPKLLAWVEEISVLRERIFSAPIQVSWIPALRNIGNFILVPRSNFGGAGNVRVCNENRFSSACLFLAQNFQKRRASAPTFPTL